MRPWAAASIEGVMMLNRVLAKLHAGWHRMWRPVGRAYYTRLVRGQVVSAGPGLRVNGRSVVFGGGAVRIGSNVHFNGMTIQGSGGVTIGDNFHSGRDCTIYSVNHRWEGATALPYDAEVVREPVVIGNNVWLGEHVLVLPGSQIGDGAIVGAGAVVSGTIDELAIAVGVPARAVKYRDRDEYERLVRERRFH
jgi:chloramphenicol O-acetyltransferase type B